MFFVLLTALVLALEGATLGWQDSSVRRLLSGDKSARRDALLYGLQIFGIMPALTFLASFGLSYAVGAACGEIIRASTGLGLRIATGSIAADAVIFLFVWSLFEYIDHRLLHARWFWPLHRLHHSATEFTTLTTGRNHPALFAFEPLIRVWVTALLATPVQLIGAWTLVNAVYAMVIHSRVYSSWGRFGRWVLISPAAHRVHHSALPEHQGKNISQLFTLFDHLFGTWCEPPAEPPPMGIPGEPERHLLAELRDDLLDFIRLRNRPIDNLDATPERGARRIDEKEHLVRR